MGFQAAWAWLPLAQRVGVGLGHRKEGLCFVLTEPGTGKVPAGASWVPGLP